MTRRLAFALAVLLGAAAGCTTAPPPKDPALQRAAEAAARADAAASQGRLRDALDGYREAARLAPADARYAAREKDVRDAFVAKRSAEADEALGRKDVAAARRAAVSILEVDPNAAAGYRALAKAAEAEGALEDAWAAAKRAHEIDASDPALDGGARVPRDEDGPLGRGRGPLRGARKDGPGVPREGGGGPRRVPDPEPPGAARGARPSRRG